MSKLNRKMRRHLERQGKAHQISYELQEQEIDDLRTSIRTGLEAAVVRTLRKRFKFGDTRLKQFVEVFDQVLDETHSGVLLLGEDDSFEKFRSELSAEKQGWSIEEL